MSHIPLIKQPGLYKSPNEMTATPDGALVKAHNTVIRSKDVLEPRRGQYTSCELVDYSDQVFSYKGTPIYHTADLNLSRVEGAVETVYDGSYLAPDDQIQRMRSLEAAGNVYFTTNRGIYKLDEVTGEPYAAGAKKTADLNAQFVTIGTVGFLGPQSRVAYRSTFVTKDASGNYLEGSPSGRAFSVNESTTDSTNVRVAMPIPYWIEEGTFVRVYRTIQVPEDTDPGDEMALIKEYKLTATEINNRFYTFDDKQDDDMRGAFLYTNPNSGEGILQANEPPPMAADITFWKERAWFANTKQPQRLFLDLLGVGLGASGSTGVRLGDVLTISGHNFLAWDPDGTMETLPSGWSTFALYFDLPNQSQNIEASARALVQAINGVVSPSDYFVPLRSYYISGPAENPGRMVIEAHEPNTGPFSITVDTYAQEIMGLSRTSNVVTVATKSYHGMEAGDTFTVSATTPNANFPVGTKTVVARTGDQTFTYAETGSNATLTVTTQNYRAKRLTPNPGLAWNPELPKTDGSSGFTVESEAEEIVNRLYFSKFQQVEAVPLVNYIDIGAKGKKIIRILPQGDKLFVLKEEGVFVVFNEFPFTMDSLDPTVRIFAPDSAVSINNQIIAFTNQGIVSISEAGVVIIDSQIAPELLKFFTEDDETFGLAKRYIFGMARESDRMYEIWVPPDNESITPTHAYVYNTTLGTWTETEGLERSCGIVIPETDKLAMGNRNAISERRTFTTRDYYDDEFLIEPSEVLPTTRQLRLDPSDYYQVGVGDIVYDSMDTDQFYLVTELDDANFLITLGGTLPPPVSEFVTVMKAIPVEIQWSSQNAGTANDLKHFQTQNHIFRAAFFTNAKTTYITDVVPTQSEIVFEGNKTNLADVESWAFIAIPFQKRAVLDSDHQFATFISPGIKICEALSFFKLIGSTLNYEPVNTVTGQ